MLAARAVLRLQWLTGCPFLGSLTLPRPALSLRLSMLSSKGVSLATCPTAAIGRAYFRLEHVDGRKPRPEIPTRAFSSPWQQHHFKQPIFNSDCLSALLAASQPHKIPEPAAEKGRGFPAMPCPAGHRAGLGSFSKGTACKMWSTLT